MTEDNNKLKPGPHGNSSVSLVVPCTAQDTVHIENVLKSVNYQMLLPTEVIIAISGISPMAAQWWKQKWRKQLDSGVRLVISDQVEPSFAGWNRQRGADLARGEIISYFDADDVQAPLRLEKISQAFSKPGIQAVFHRCRFHRVAKIPEVDRKAWFDGAIRMYHRGWPSTRREVANKVTWKKRARAQEFLYLDDLIETYGKKSIALIPDFLGYHLPSGLQHDNSKTDDRISLLQDTLESYKSGNQP
jgi:hypothetical protein